MSSLAAQLQVLSGTGVAKETRYVTKQPSFLFEPNVAAETDSQTIYELGLNGFVALLQIDKRFTAFEKTLFKHTSGHISAFNRDSETTEVTAALDLSIGSILTILSPHFLIKPAHKVLEYLIRRYKIQDHNVNEILACMLPYHETVLFARMLQLLKLGSDVKWQFLREAQKNRSPLARETLVIRSLADHSLLEFVWNAAKACVAASTDGAHHQHALALQLVLVLDCLEKCTGNVPEPLVRNIVPQVQTGLKQSRWPECRMASSLMLTALCRKTSLNPKVIERLAVDLVKRLPVDLPAAALSQELLPLVCIFQTQVMEVFPPAVLGHLVKQPQLPAGLANLSRKYEATAFLRLLLSALGQGKRTPPKGTEDLLQHIAQSLKGTRHEVHSGKVSDLFLALESQTVSTRVKAVNALAALITKDDIETDFAAKMLKGKLNDPDLRVVDKVLSVRQLVSLVSAEDLFSALLPLVELCTTTLRTQMFAAVIERGLYKPRKVSALRAAILIVLCKAAKTDVQREQLFCPVLSNLIVPDRTSAQRNCALLAVCGPVHPLLEDIGEVTKEAIVALLDVQATMSHLTRKDTNVKLDEAIASLHDVIVTHLARKIKASPDLSLAKALVQRAAEGSDEQTLSLLVLNRVIVLCKEEEKGSKQKEAVTTTLTAIDALADLTMREWTTNAEPDDGAPTEKFSPLPPSVGTFASYRRLLRHSLSRAVSAIPSLQSAAADDNNKQQQQATELITKLFVFLVSSSIAEFRQPLRLFFSQHLPSPNAAIKFLATLWTCDNASSTPTVAVRALHLANAQLTSVSNLKGAELLQLVPNLLLGLAHPLKSARHAALLCLETVLATFQSRPTKGGKKKWTSKLTPKHELSNEEEMLRAVLPPILVHTAELLEDPTFLTTGLLKIVAKKSIPAAHATAFADCLLTALPASTPSAQATILAALRNLPPASLLPHTLPLLSGVLKEGAPRIAARVASLALATLVATDSMAFDGVEAMFLSLLASSATLADGQRVSTLVARAVTPAFFASLQLPLQQKVLDGLLLLASRNTDKKSDMDKKKPKRTFPKRPHNRKKKNKGNNKQQNKQQNQNKNKNNKNKKKNDEHDDDDDDDIEHNLAAVQAALASLRLLTISSSLFLPHLSMPLGRRSPKAKAVGTPTKAAAAAAAAAAADDDDDDDASDASDASGSASDSDSGDDDDEDTSTHHLAPTVALGVLHGLLAPSQEEAPSSMESAAGSNAARGCVLAPQVLVAPLFRLLAALQHPNLASGSFEFPKQLVLGCLVSLIQLSSSRSASPSSPSSVPNGDHDSDDEEGSPPPTSRRLWNSTKSLPEVNGTPKGTYELDVEDLDLSVLVQCVPAACRNSVEEAITRNHALLLLSAVAQLAPDKVLDVLYPVLANLFNAPDDAEAGALAADQDAYSFSVIQQTLQTVLPPLLRRHTPASSSSSRSFPIAPLLLVFVNAAPGLQAGTRVRVLEVLHATLGVAAREAVPAGAPPSLETHLQGTIALLLAKMACTLQDKELAEMSIQAREGKKKKRVSAARALKTSAMITTQSTQRYDAVVDFATLCHKLLLGFGQNQQVYCLVQLAALLDLPSIESARSRSPRKRRRTGQSEAVLLGEVLSEELGRAPTGGGESTGSASEHLRRWQLLVIDFVGRHLAQPEFDTRLGGRRVSSERRRQDQQRLSLFECLFARLQTCNATVHAAQKQLVGIRRKDSEGSQAERECLEQLAHANALGDFTRAAIDRLTTMLTVKGFLSLVQQLITHDNAQVRRKALHLLQIKAEAEQSYMPSEPDAEDRAYVAKKIRLFVALIPGLGKLLHTDTKLSTKRRAEQVKDQEAVLGCVQELATLCVASTVVSCHAVFLALVPSLLALAQDRTNLRLSGRALLCLASLGVQMGMAFLPSFPSVVDAALSALHHALDHAGDGNKPSELLLASLLSLQDLTSTLPRFLSSKLPSLLSGLMHASLSHLPEGVDDDEMDSGTQEASDAGDVRLAARVVTRTLFTLASEVDARVVLPHVYALLPSLIKNSQNDKSLCRVSWFCGLVASQFDRSSTSAQGKGLFSFFIRVFGARRMRPDLDVDALEDVATEGAMRLVVKLTEDQLKGFFLDLLQWMDVSNVTLTSVGNLRERQAAVRDSVENSLPVFKLVRRLVSTLKGIFVPYFGYLIDYCVLFLTTADEDDKDAEEGAEGGEGEGDEGDEEEKSSRKRRRVAHSLPMATQLSMRLGESVLQCLSACFTHDTAHFLGKEHFDKLVAPLTKQLCNKTGRSDTEYTAFIEDCVTPCLGNLVARMGNYTLWKPLNHAVCLTTRHPLPIVRLAAMNTLFRFFDQLHEKYLVMMAETIPFIAEAMEDPDAHVEAAAQALVKKLEMLSGESLDEYLQ